MDITKSLFEKRFVTFLKLKRFEYGKFKTTLHLDLSVFSKNNLQREVEYYVETRSCKTPTDLKYLIKYPRTKLLKY